MTNHKVFAIILNDEIMNLIVAENIIIADLCAKEVSIEGAYAVECTDYKCSIGDYYIDNTFYFKDKVTPIPNTSIESILNDLESSRNIMRDDLKSLSNEYKELLDSFDKLRSDKIAIEEALCELSILVANKEG